ncbi:MAG: SdrD B-like domain-containing protein [Lachnospiraceae bacterium]|nr:SdrD B-like domain-containing protein [Lachnospiraceae bacterium]
MWRVSEGLYTRLKKLPHNLYENRRNYARRMFAFGLALILVCSNLSVLSLQANAEGDNTDVILQETEVAAQEDTEQPQEAAGTETENETPVESTGEPSTAEKAPEQTGAESKPDDSIDEEKPEEVHTTEAANEEPTTQEPTIQEPTTEEPTTQEPTTEETTSEEITTEEPTTEEITTETAEEGAVSYETEEIKKLLKETRTLSAFTYEKELRVPLHTASTEIDFPDTVEGTVVVEKIYEIQTIQRTYQERSEETDHNEEISTNEILNQELTTESTETKETILVEEKVIETKEEIEKSEETHTLSVSWKDCAESEDGTRSGAYDEESIGTYRFVANLSQEDYARQKLNTPYEELAKEDMPLLTVLVGEKGPVVLTSDLGVTVTAESEEIIPQETKLEVEKIEVSQDSLKSIADKETAINYDNMVAAPLNISLELQKEEIQPDGKVEVSIEIPKEIHPDTAAVYYIAEDGSVEKENGHIESGCYIFETTHLSTRAVVGEGDSEEPSDYLSINIQKPTLADLGNFTAYNSNNSNCILFFTKMELVSGYKDTAMTITLPKEFSFYSYDTHTNLELQKFLAAGDVVKGTNEAGEETLTYKPSKVSTGNIAPMIGLEVNKSKVIPGVQVTVTAAYEATKANGDKVTEEESFTVTPNAATFYTVDAYNNDYSTQYKLDPVKNLIVETYVSGSTDGPGASDWKIQAKLPAEAAYAAEDLQSTLPEGVTRTYDTASHTVTFTGASLAAGGSTGKLYYKVDFTGQKEELSKLTNGVTKTYQQTEKTTFTCKEIDAQGAYTIEKAGNCTSSYYYYYTQAKPASESDMYGYIYAYSNGIQSVEANHTTQYMRYTWRNYTLSDYKDFSLKMNLPKNIGDVARLNYLSMSDDNNEYEYVLHYTTNLSESERTFTFTRQERIFELPYNEYLTGMSLTREDYATDYDETKLGDSYSNHDVELNCHGYSPIYSDTMDLLGPQSCKISSSIAAVEVTGGATGKNFQYEKSEITLSSVNTMTYDINSYFWYFEPTETWPGNVFSGRLIIETQQGINPITYIILPQGVKYIEGSIKDSAPEVKVIKNYDGKGSSLLSIEYYGKTNGGHAFNETSRYLSPKFVVDASCEKGKLMLGDNVYSEISERNISTDLQLSQNTRYLVADTHDVNRNGSTTDKVFKPDRYYAGEFINILMPTGSSGVYNSINSTLVTDLTADAVYTVGQSATYNFGIRSGDNMKNLEIYVPIPKKGSMTLADTNYTNDWSASLTGAATYEGDAEDVTLSYTTGTVGSASEAAGLSYSTATPSDWSQVTCVKVEKTAATSEKGFDFHLPISIPKNKTSGTTLSAYMGAYAVYQLNENTTKEKKYTDPLQMALVDYTASGYVWKDENANGKRDTSEPVVTGHKVTLFDSSNHKVKETTTDSTGLFEFTINTLSTYTILVDELPDYFVTAMDNAGAGDYKDSDIDQETRKYTFTMNESHTYVNHLGAGFVPPTKFSLTEEESSLVMLEGSTKKLTYTVMPEDGRTPVFISSNPAIVQVTPTGYITCKQAGTANISMELSQLYGNGAAAKATIQVTVKARVNLVITVKQDTITIREPEYSSIIDNEVKKNYTVTYGDYTEKKSETVTYIDEKGNSVYTYDMYQKSGTYYGTITATDTFGQTSKGKITVVIISKYAKAEGTVKDENGNVVAGVNLTCRQGAATYSIYYTTSTGAYYTANLKNGDYSIIATVGTQKYVFPLTIAEGAVTSDTDLVIRTEEAVAEIAGKVTLNGNTMYYAHTVSLINKATGTILQTIQNSGNSYGQFRFYVESDDTYTVKVTYNGNNYSKTVTVDGMLSGDANIDLNTETRMGPSLTGTVFGNDGEVAAGISVVIKKDGEDHLTLTTNQDGVYNVDDQKDGTYTTEATQGEKTKKITITISNGVIQGSPSMDINLSTKVVVDKVTVTGAARVNIGKSEKYQAQVTGENDPSQEVTWSIQGDHHADTTMGTDGTLQVAPEETADNIVIRGTSTEDTTKYGEKTVEITKTLYEVSFDMQGHGTPIAKVTKIVPDNKLVAPTEPQEAGYTFNGWFKEQTCENAWNFEEDTVGSNITLYAKWTEKMSASLKGKVSYENKVPVEGAAITLNHKTTEESITVDTNGKSFVTDVNGGYIVEKLPDGTYDMKVTITVNTETGTEQQTAVITGIVSENGKITDFGKGQEAQGSTAASTAEAIVVVKPDSVTKVEEKLEALPTPPAENATEEEIAEKKEEIAQKEDEFLDAKSDYEKLPDRYQDQIEPDLKEKLDSLIKVFLDIKTKVEASEGVKIKAGNLNELAGLLFTKDEIETDIGATEAKKATVTLRVQEQAEAGEGNSDQSTLQKFASDNSKKTGIYLDISVEKQIEGDEAKKISQTPKNLEISIEIPESIRGNSNYQVASVHEGGLCIHDTTQHGDTLTFYSNKFSTYAILYNEEGGGSGNKPETGGDSGNDTGNTGGDSGNTGNDSGNSGGDSGNTGNDSGNSGTDTGNGSNSGNDGGNSSHSSSNTTTPAVIPLVKPADATVAVIDMPQADPNITGDEGNTQKNKNNAGLEGENIPKTGDEAPYGIIILLILAVVFVKVILWGYFSTEDEWKQKKQKNAQAVSRCIAWGKGKDKKKCILAISLIMLHIMAFRCEWECYCLVKKILHREVTYAIR